jgi:hypothetical protein
MPSLGHVAALIGISLAAPVGLSRSPAVPLMVLSVLALPSVARAITLEVCTSTCGWSTIGDAAAVATSGDVIEVAAGTCVECSLSVAAGVRIQGAGRSTTIIDTQGCANDTTLTLGDGASAPAPPRTLRGAQP